VQVFTCLHLNLELNMAQKKKTKPAKPKAAKKSIHKVIEQSEEY